MNNQRQYRESTLVTLFFLFAVAVIIARRPDVFFDPKPWAEDGALWIQGIYNNGFFTTLLRQAAGYYQSASVLTYGFSLFFGIKYSVLIANCISIAIRAALVTFIISERMNFANIYYRIFISLYILFMPNVAEGYINITNAQWYLCIYLMAVLLADKPPNAWWKAHDLMVMVLSAMSGPFVLFIAPCLLVKRMAERSSLRGCIRHINLFDIVFILCFFIQLATVFFSLKQGRARAPLGATPGLLADILYYKLITGSFFELVEPLASRNSLAAIASVSALLLSVAYFSVRAGWRFFICLLFSVLVLSSSLAMPLVTLDGDQWPLLLTPVSAGRYFYIPNVAFFSFILFAFHKMKKIALPALFTFGIMLAWLYAGYFTIPPVPGPPFASQVRQFAKLPPGESMEIHIAPPGWKMRLVAK